eukprot:m.2126 g.2126  ORF g.2126 m.2126 type:complete len:85 (+) comp1013_c0_seq2:1554-1808(+)
MHACKLPAQLLCSAIGSTQDGTVTGDLIGQAAKKGYSRLFCGVPPLFGNLQKPGRVQPSERCKHPNLQRRCFGSATALALLRRP